MGILQVSPFAPFAQPVILRYNMGNNLWFFRLGPWARRLFLLCLTEVIL